MEGDLTTVACNPGTLAFFAVAGTTYYILVIDDQADGGANGGMLSISFDEPPPPPTVDVTVDPVAHFDKSGNALLGGTYTCSNADFISVSGNVRQAVGRFVIHGFFEFSDSGTCDGMSHAWLGTTFSDNGKIRGGKVTAGVSAFGCGPFECGDAFAQQTVSMRGGR